MSWKRCPSESQGTILPDWSRRWGCDGAVGAAKFPPSSVIAYRGLGMPLKVELWMAFKASRWPSVMKKTGMPQRPNSEDIRELSLT